MIWCGFTENHSNHIISGITPNIKKVDVISEPFKILVNIVSAINNNNNNNNDNNNNNNNNDNNQNTNKNTVMSMNTGRNFPRPASNVFTK